MRSSYRLGRFFDIDVRVHITFFLLPLLMAFSAFGRRGSLTAAAVSIAFLFITFAIVVMHEYGHALTARRFGIRTKSITLYPIGGVAMLESLPKKPWQQILVAIAGPAVNFVLAGAIAVAMSMLGYDVTGDALESTSLGASVLGALLQLNIVLGLFNLLPALPMDGGRVLNAALAMKMGPLRATQIASRVAKVVALLMGAYALFGRDEANFMLAFIAMFVWSASNAERRAAEQQARMSGEGFTEVLRKSPWDRMGARPPWAPQGPTQRGPGEVIEVVEGPHGPEVRIFRPREGSS